MDQITQVLGKGTKCVNGWERVVAMHLVGNMLIVATCNAFVLLQYFFVLTVCVCMWVSHKFVSFGVS